MCLACQRVCGGRLCERCVRSLRPAADRLLPGGLRLVAAFEHVGPAKTLVHHLKYRGVFAYAELVADRLASDLPPLPLVPVPRALSRRMKYGVDPARVIAQCLAVRIGSPVVDALRGPLHAARRAGRDHSRPVRPYRLRSSLRSQVILVDDVVTTGATIAAAAAAMDLHRVRLVVAANVVPEMYNVAANVTSPEPGVDRFGNRSDRRRR